jgi:hypothetical protein
MNQDGCGRNQPNPTLEYYCGNLPDRGKITMKNLRI